ncbi:antitoxin (DNA-binding transcriptional repressor) of toxin-antitoxin stability system [Sphingomonas vulcanisoli]|uniref:Antitoxin (DNA-binding transcriptional repressor) of toxin-antitoxin stability system n=1 Tax=Sphingomonas vulcanisoli TaxID=1658060 RepID=A0ABX0TSY9_9SPHN|nr:type II toxin-antitoxin system prevent-host-death family antitoxin [Sphingomonas vulcanisoli]NIJ07512.1 antitoxin (DNA-binding transcriptional repressor) of toxin-antitoxin stability system [Sphingomonas vulcanisoli]
MAEADPSKTFAVDGAGDELSSLLDSARGGDITLTKNGRPIGRLVRFPDPPKGPRKPGRWKDLLGTISDEDLFAPAYTDEELDRFYNEDIDPTRR